MPGKSRGPINLVPYPQEVKVLPGTTLLDSSSIVEVPPLASLEEKLAAEEIKKSLQGASHPGKALKIKVGSLATLGTKQAWLSAEQTRFLRQATSDQAYVLTVGEGGITIVGKTPPGALHGTQTLLQLRQRRREGYAIRNLEIRDFPSVENRFVAIAMSWYAGY
jgi:hypothetical protein